MFGKKKAEELNLGDIVGSSNSRQSHKKEKEKKQKKHKEPKEKKQKNPKQPRNGKQVLAYAMIIVGGMLCIRSISALA